MAGKLNSGELVIGDRTIRFGWRWSRRAKHLRLQVEAGGKICLVLPEGVEWREGEKFLRARRQWLIQALKKLEKIDAEQPQRKFISGEKLPLLGEERQLQIVFEPGRHRVFLVDGKDFVRIRVGSKAAVKPAIVKWYRREAHDYFTWLTNRLAKKIGNSVKRLVISDASTQWGSCNKTTGRISLHWRLLLGPREIADYVAAHEVAHLQIAAHNQEFWRLVEKLQPGAEGHRKWLKRHGHKLIL